MYAGKTLGILTTHLSQDFNRYIAMTEVAIPLLEGGLTYRGVLSAVDSADVLDISMAANKNVFDALRVQNGGSTGQYTVTIQDVWQYPPVPPVPFVPPPDAQEVFDLVLSPEHVNEQTFAGLVTHVRSGDRAKFIYQDIREPLTLGVIAIVVVGAAVIMCAANQLIGYFANRACKKVEVTYGFKFNFRDVQFGSDIGCHVRCLDE